MDEQFLQFIAGVNFLVTELAHVPYSRKRALTPLLY